MEPIKPRAGTGQMKRVAERSDPMLDRTIGNYRLVRKIGQGGMGAVYEALHTSDGTRAAVKVLLRQTMDDPNAARRFFNEAKAISLVSHPSLVKIFEYGTCEADEDSEGEAYIVMEYIDGETLRARLAKRYVGGSSLRLMRQIGSALAATHKKRIVHRDLKPDNIMLVSDPTVDGGERVKILDFGIAKLLPEAGSPELAGAVLTTNPDLGVQGAVRTVKTRTGMPIGTPAYMSPEQCRASAPPDEKTDVYSVGVIFFEMIYGEPPFTSDSAGEMYALQMFGTPPPLQARAPGVNPELAALINRMLDKKPAARPSMDEFLGELERIQSTGKTDGPIELRPSESVGHDPVDASVSSGVLRDQINERVRATDKLAQVQLPASPQQTTGIGSLGEQVVDSRYSRRSVGAIVGVGVLLLVSVGGAWLLLRPRPTVPTVQTAAQANPALVAPQVTPQVPPVTPSDPSAAVPSEPPLKPTPSPPETVGTTDGGKAKSSSKASRKPSRKTAKTNKKDKLKIDLWK